MEVILFTIVLIVVAIVCFLFGQKLSENNSKEIEFKNEEILKEKDQYYKEAREALKEKEYWTKEKEKALQENNYYKELNKKLEDESKLLNNQIEKDKQQLDFIKKESAEKQAFIDSAKDKAEQEYNNWKEAFLEQYKHFQEEYAAKQISAEEAIQNLQENLDSLRRQKAATIEAFQKEKAIQEQKDLYRLNISEQDKIDINFLRSVQYRISKPRLLAMLIWQSFFQPLAKKKFPIILGSENVCGIYKITNTLNQMCYIGQARFVYKRLCEHCKHGLGIDTPQGNKLYKAMLEDGLENFTFELLEECLPEELNEKESYYIQVYNSVNYGYNSQQGTKGNKWKK